MAVDRGFEWQRIAPVRASASPVDVDVEPIVCRRGCGVTPPSFAFSRAFTHALLMPGGARHPFRPERRSRCHPAYRCFVRARWRPHPGAGTIFRSCCRRAPAGRRPRLLQATLGLWDAPEASRAPSRISIFTTPAPPTNAGKIPGPVAQRLTEATRSWSAAISSRSTCNASRVDRRRGDRFACGGVFSDRTRLGIRARTRRRFS